MNQPPPSVNPFEIPRRTLMGPGPSDVHPRVMRAMSAPTLGHLDPVAIRVMNDIQDQLRALFGTENQATIALSSTGMSGMECCLANTIEPGDRVVICQAGFFGSRMAEIATRLGAELITVEVPYGQIVEPDLVAKAIDGKKVKLVGLVHAETSSGVQQPVSDIADIAHEAGALVLLDCVTSLGGIPVELDQWGVDMAYSVSQKCIGCPSGLAPVTFSERAMEAIRQRREKPTTWYLDIQLLMQYWSGDARAYHHTAPTNMFFALQEGLKILFEEGLDDVYARHQLHHRALVAGLEAMGLSLFVDPSIRLPQLNAVNIPEGVDDATVRKTLLNDYNIEIGGGLGSLKGRVWRVGIMGYSARRENVVTFLAALESVLGEQGAAIQKGRALAAAAEAYRSNS